MSSPNITPRHSRRSTMDYSPQDRRNSKSSSVQDPSTPSHESRPSFGNSDGLDVFSSSVGAGGDGGGGGMGLGNLADELADALSDGEDDDIEGDEEYYDNEAPAHDDGAVPPDINLSEAAWDDEDAGDREGGGGQRDSGVDIALASSPGAQRTRNTSLDLPTANGSSNARGRHHGHHKRSSVYDGSEYGSDSDLDTPGMPPSLVAKMDAVESLARRGTEENGGPSDGVCRRLIEELRDLGSQANIEGGASRLITAHSALTTHLAHQTRQLHALAFPLFSPLAVSPLMTVGGGGGADGDDGDDDDEEEDKDSLSPMLTALADQMPRPSTAAYQSLAALHGLTGDLVATLNYLSDTLHMARQTTTTATRRLRSAKELVAEMRRDEELREEGERWLARGNWDERLRRRECAHVCGEVVGGFEEVCNGWRARLLAQAEAAQASA